MAGTMNQIMYGDVRDLAYVDWKLGMRHKDIAEKYGVTNSTITSWVKKFFKPKQAFEEVMPHYEARTSEDEKEITPMNELGSQNIPKTPPPLPMGEVRPEIVPRNHEKLGKYSKLLKEELTDKEQILFNRMKIDPIKQLDESIKLYAIRELRLMKLLNRLDEDKAVVTEYEDVIIPAKKGENGMGRLDRRIRRTKLAVDKMMQLEDTLTLLQDKKARAIATRQKLIREKEEKEQSDTKVVIVNNLPRQPKEAQKKKKEEGK